MKGLAMSAAAVCAALLGCSAAQAKDRSVLVATDESTASENGMEPRQACAHNLENPHPLRSVAELNATSEERVAAILEDAEEIYREAARIVGDKPRTQLQATALAQMETQWGSGRSFQENCFQAIYFDLTDWYRTKKVHEVTTRQENTLVRVGQFDNFIFKAVGEAVNCESEKASFDLNLSRQLLDHGWLEFKGHPEEIDWDPDNLYGPDAHQECIDDFLTDDPSFAKATRLLNAWIARYKAETPATPRDCSNIKPENRKLDCALPGAADQHSGFNSDEFPEGTVAEPQAKDLADTAHTAMVDRPTPSSQSNPEPTPPWLELRNGVQAYTDDDGGDATTLTVCDSSQAWLDWADTESDKHCTHRPKGMAVTIASDKIVAIDLGPNNPPRYVVFIRADDSSWSGWTGTLGLKPRIPPHTQLHVGGLEARLAPKQDSGFNVGDDLPKGTVAELISQDPKSDRDLYVRVGDRRGWLLSLDVAAEVTFQPAESGSLTWQFDCGDLAPRSHFYDTGDYGRAFKEVEPLANERCTEAEHLLGVMYAQGRGVQKDFVHAYALLLLAYSDGMAPNGKTAVIPVLGDDEDELEIVQFGAQLTADQLDSAEILAKEARTKERKARKPGNSESRQGCQFSQGASSSHRWLPSLSDPVLARVSPLVPSKPPSCQKNGQAPSRQLARPSRRRPRRQPPETHRNGGLR